MNKKLSSGKTVILIIYILLIISVCLFFIVHKTGILQKDRDLSKQSFSTFDRYSIDSFFSIDSTYDDKSILCYNADIDIPDNLDNIGLMIPPIDGEYKLYINNNIYIDRDTERSHVFGQPYIIGFKPTTNHLNIKICLPSNGSLNNIVSPLKNGELCIGRVEALYYYQNYVTIVDVFLIVLCVTSFIFQLFNYFARNNRYILLVSCLLSLSVMVCILFSDQRVITIPFNNISAYLAIKIALLAFTFRFIGLHMYYYYSAEQNIPKKYNFRLIILTIISILLVFMVPFRYSYYLRAFIFIVTDLLYLYTLVKYFLKIKNISNTQYFIQIMCLLTLFPAMLTDTLKAFASNNFFIIAPICYTIFFVYNDIANTVIAKHQLANIQKLTVNLKDAVFELQNNKSTYISSHIKPTYLYESLDSIYNNIDVDYDKVDVLIQSLSKYLRETLDFNGQENTHSLADELEFCEAYTTLIQSLQPNISINYDIQDELPAATLPKYAIQALIENSILHGTEGVLHPTITIKVTCEQDKIFITVSDNGPGMTDKEIQEAKRTPKSLSHIGLYYINQQLKDMHNTQLNIQSKSYKATSVSINIHTTMEVQND